VFKSKKWNKKSRETVPVKSCCQPVVGSKDCFWIHVLHGDIHNEPASNIGGFCPRPILDFYHPRDNIFLLLSNKLKTWNSFKGDINWRSVTYTWNVYIVMYEHLCCKDNDSSGSPIFFCPEGRWQATYIRINSLYCVTPTCEAQAARPCFGAPASSRPGSEEPAAGNVTI
jgi:hypothetical protein